MEVTIREAVEMVAATLTRLAGEQDVVLTPTPMAWKARMLNDFCHEKPTDAVGTESNPDQEPDSEPDSIVVPDVQPDIRPEKREFFGYGADHSFIVKRGRYARCGVVYMTFHEIAGNIDVTVGFDGIVMDPQEAIRKADAMLRTANVAEGLRQALLGVSVPDPQLGWERGLLGL